MKKPALLLVCILVTVFFATFGLSACQGDIPDQIDTHTHDYGEIWEFDNTNHYKTCTVCGAKNYEEEHSGIENCTVCNFHFEDTAGLDYELNDNENGYILTGIGSVTDNIIRIPETYNDLSVISIKSKVFYHNEKIAYVIIPDTV